jgi:hypothetical protein
VLKVP